MELDSWSVLENKCKASRDQTVARMERHQGQLWVRPRLPKLSPSHVNISAYVPAWQHCSGISTAVLVIMKLQHDTTSPFLLETSLAPTSGHLRFFSSPLSILDCPDHGNWHITALLWSTFSFTALVDCELCQGMALDLPCAEHSMEHMVDMQWKFEKWMSKETCKNSGYF